MIEYNDSRDEHAIKEIRPYLPIEEIEQEIENFQNQVLRPILKMQHNILLDVLLAQPNFDAVLGYSDKRNLFRERLRIFIQQPFLKGIFTGMVVGCFTREEYSVYAKHSKEFNKRIFQMTLQRFSDSL